MKQGLKIGDNVVNKFYSFAHGMISIIITFLFSSQKPVIIFSSKLIEVISLLPLNPLETCLIYLITPAPN